MNRSDIVNNIQQSLPHHAHATVKGCVDAIVEAMTSTLADDGRIEVRGFGSFSVRKQDAHMARNPKSGEKVAVTDKNRIYFRPGKLLKARVNS